jgi:hypothetical protein
MSCGTGGSYRRTFAWKTVDVMRFAIYTINTNLKTIPVVVELTRLTYRLGESFTRTWNYKSLGLTQDPTHVIIPARLMFPPFAVIMRPPNRPNYPPLDHKAVFQRQRLLRWVSYTRSAQCGPSENNE